MTQRYAHLRDEKLKEASAIVGDIITEVSSEANKGDFIKVVNLK